MPKVALLYRREIKAPPYQRALKTAGLDPVSFRPGGETSLDGITGLVLTGGSDVDPALYGEPLSPECGETDRERDDYEIELLGQALRQNMPVLAICRGMQLLNVARGGTLIQHLAASAKHKTEPHE